MCDLLWSSERVVLPPNNTGLKRKIQIEFSASVYKETGAQLAMDFGVAWVAIYPTEEELRKLAEMLLKAADAAHAEIVKNNGSLT